MSAATQAQCRPQLAEQVEAFRRFTVAHPRMVQAKDDLANAIEASAPGSLILVVGPTGVGKTTLRRKVEDLLSERLASILKADPGRVPFVSLEAVAPDNGSFQWRDHFQRLLLKMHEPLIEHKIGLLRVEGERQHNGRYAPWPRGYTGYQLQQSVENALHYRRPAAVFVDEAQHLGKMASGRKLADQLDVVKSIASRTGAIHVLIGTYDLLAFRNLSGQLSRRSIDLHLSRYRSESAEDLEIFQNVVFTFQQQLPNSLELLSVWDLLYERSLGCIGVLKDWLVRALIAAVRRSRTGFTRAELEQTALSAAQCEKMLSETREGEARLGESRDAQLRLRNLLNLPMTSAKVAEASSQSRVGRVPSGLRRPRRDQIGTRQVAHA